MFPRSKTPGLISSNLYVERGNHVMSKGRRNLDTKFTFQVLNT